MTTIGLLILFTSFILLPTNPGYSALLVLVLVLIDRTVGWGDSPGNDWPAAIVTTLALGSIIWFSVEGAMRLLTT